MALKLGERVHIFLLSAILIRKMCANISNIFYSLKAIYIFMQKDPQNRKENIKSSLIKLSLFLQKRMIL
tara:strand:+ start:118 stop:324 length:207 start_codon:yes stop_codon:yes gene_type:complete